MNKKTYHDIKICVYAIAADEPTEFIDRWLDSMSGADVITVLITKANNPNYSYFLEKQALSQFKDKLIVEEKNISPWRFDVARNESMKLIPKDKVDVCISTDIDEILIPDFWDDLRKVVFEHPNFERIYYQYAWSHDAETGEPKWHFWYDKIHKPEGWLWQYPVHEALYCPNKKKLGYAGEYRLDAHKIYLHHYPDSTKSRGNYLPLLELRAQEYPDDTYGLFYLAREYSYVADSYNALRVALQLYTKLLSNKTLEEAIMQDDMLMLPALACMIGDFFNSLNMITEAEFFYLRSFDFDIGNREGYIKLAQLYAYTPNKYEECYEILRQMEQKSRYVVDWRLLPWMWRDWKKYQIYADAACWEGNYKKAYDYITLAKKDIKTTDDERDAYAQNFYSDMNFILEHYENNSLHDM